MANLGSQQPGRWSTWLNLWTLLCLPAFGFAIIIWGILPTFYVSLAIAFMAILVLIGPPGRSSDAHESWGAKMVRMARVSLCAAASFLTLMMLAQVSGAFWLLLLILMVATMPPSVARWRGALGRILNESRNDLVDSQPVDEEDRLPGAIPLSDLSDIELCWLWRHSFWALDSTPSPDERIRIVSERQEILDELTRRNAAAVEAWLASGARASSSPERFFDGDDSGQPAAA